MTSFSLGSLLFRSDAAKAAKAAKKRKPPNCVKGVLVGNSCQSKDRLKKKAEGATKAKAATKKPAATKKAKPATPLAASAIAPPKSTKAKAPRKTKAAKVETTKTPSKIERAKKIVSATKPVDKDAIAKAAETEVNPKKRESRTATGKKASKTPDFSKMTPQASGEFGDVYFVGDSVFKVPKGDIDVANIEREVQVQKAIPSAPKIRSYNKKTNVIEMEKVDGETLWGMEGKSPGEVKVLISQSIDTLSEIHTAGYSHGDWRGPNQIFKKDGTIAPIDFGFAKSIKDSSGNTMWSEAVREMTVSFGLGPNQGLQNGFNLDRGKIGWGNNPTAPWVSSMLPNESQKRIYEQYVDELKMALYQD